MKIIGIIVAALLLIGIGVYLSMCPCGRIPGAWLFGDRPEAVITDWSFVNDREIAPLCQVQVSTWRPHSINLNCMSDEGALFVSCSRCADKNWSNSALEHPDGHIRIGEIVYPVTLQRVTDVQKLDAIWRARLAKIKAEPSARPDHWWSFELTAR